MSENIITFVCTWPYTTKFKKKRPEQGLHQQFDWQRGILTLPSINLAPVPFCNANCEPHMEQQSFGLGASLHSPWVTSETEKDVKVFIYKSERAMRSS